MLTITMEVNRPAGQAIGIKEAIAMDMEKYGDVKVISITEKIPEQTRLQNGKVQKLETQAVQQPVRGM